MPDETPLFVTLRTRVGELSGLLAIPPSRPEEVDALCDSLLVAVEDVVGKWLAGDDDAS